MFKRRTEQRAIAVLGSLIAAAIVGMASPAIAATGRPDFQLPFPCGQDWSLGTHSGHTAYAVDMNAPDDYNKPILASYAGTVVKAGPDGNAGIRVQIDHGGGWLTTYHHLASTPPVGVGTWVDQGRIIGHVGSTGESTGPHLHYEQRHNGTTVQAHFNGVAAVYNTTVRSTLCTGGLYRQADGRMAVLVGGKPAWFYDMSELEAAGYLGLPYVSVPIGWLDSRPTTTTAGIINAPNSPHLHVYAGGAKYHLDGPEWGQYDNRPSITVAHRWFNQQGNRPLPGTIVGLLKGHEIYQVLDFGIRYLRWEDYVALGNPSWTPIPWAWIEQIGCTDQFNNNIC